MDTHQSNQDVFYNRKFLPLLFGCNYDKYLIYFSLCPYGTLCIVCTYVQRV